MKFKSKLGFPDNDAYVQMVRHYCDRRPELGKLHTTQLTSPPRIYYLTMRHWPEIIIYVEDKVHAIRGQIFHDRIKDFTPGDKIAEEKLTIQVSGWQIIGRPDYFDLTSLADWKDTSIWTVVYDSAKKDYVQQLNVYRYILKENSFAEINTLKNIYFLRDWSMSKASRDSSLPQLGIEVVEQEVWPYEETRLFLEERVQLFQGLEFVRDKDLPECTPEERWYRGEKWAVKKKANKRATKLCDTKDEAEELLKQKHKGVDCMEFRRGEDIRCKWYCDCRDFCNYYKETYSTA